MTSVMLTQNHDDHAMTCLPGASHGDSEPESAAGGLQGHESEYHDSMIWRHHRLRVSDDHDYNDFKCKLATGSPGRPARLKPLRMWRHRVPPCRAQPLRANGPARPGNHHDAGGGPGRRRRLVQCMIAGIAATDARRRPPGTVTVTVTVTVV